MAAAVADFRPARPAASKIKKGTATPTRSRSTRNPDILRELVAERGRGQVIVGFAAETGDEAGDVLDHGRAKLERKGCDLLVVNAVGEGGPSRWRTTRAGCSVPTDRRGACRWARRQQLAARVWDAVAERLPERSTDRRILTIRR